MNAADYRPVYDDTVYESLPGMKDVNGNPVTSRWPINPAYCLMRSSALILAKLFTAGPKVVMRAPLAQASGSPFAFSHTVPWLEFPNGELRNAADLAAYWGMPGVPYSEALAYAQEDVATPVEGQ